MPLEQVLKDLRTRYAGKGIVIENSQIARDVANLLRKNRVYDYMRTVPVGNRNPDKVEQLIRAALGPAEAHGSGMGGRRVALFLTNLGKLDAEQIHSIPTSFFCGGATDFSSMSWISDRVFYVADSTSDVDRLRNPFFFGEDYGLITEKGIVPLYSGKRLAQFYLETVKERLKPEYFKFDLETRKDGTHIERTLEAFLKLMQYTSHLNANDKKDLPHVEQQFYSMLDAGLAEFRYKGRAVSDGGIKYALDKWRYSKRAKKGTSTPFHISPEEARDIDAWFSWVSILKMLKIIFERRPEGSYNIKTGQAILSPYKI